MIAPFVMFVGQGGLRLVIESGRRVGILDLYDSNFSLEAILVAIESFVGLPNRKREV